MEDYSEHFSEDSFWTKLKQYAAKAGRRVIERALILYFCFRDGDTPAWAKSIILGALGYFVLPLDAITDMTPGVGYGDDYGALLMAMSIVALHIKPEHEHQAGEKLRNWFGVDPEGDHDPDAPSSIS